MTESYQVYLFILPGGEEVTSRGRSFYEARQSLWILWDHKYPDMNSYKLKNK